MILETLLLGGTSFQRDPKVLSVFSRLAHARLNGGVIRSIDSAHFPLFE